MFILFRKLTIALTAAIALLVAGCGGGGTTAGGGGAVGTGGASSTLIIDLQGNGFGANDPESQQRAIAIAFAKLISPDAWAQLSDTTLIFINGNPVTATIIDGDAYIPLAPGDYLVCINAAGVDATDPNCEMVTVGADQIVKITGTDDGLGNVALNTVSVENAADNVALFQDPNAANKTLVCHKDKMTLSVGTPAALNGHMVHGDSLGACAVAEGGSTTGNNGNNGNNGNKGNNGNRGNGNNGNGNGNNPT